MPIRRRRDFSRSQEDAKEAHDEENIIGLIPAMKIK
jgi:hypothetical protein